MSSTMTNGSAPTRTYACTRRRRILRSIILSIELLMLGVAGWMATWNDPQAFMNAACLAVIMLVLIGMTALPMFKRIDTSPGRLDYRSLFGSKHLEIRDVCYLDVEFFKGSKMLTVKTDQLAISITDQTVSNQALDELAEFIYAGAEATGNVRLKRPIAQKKFSDFEEAK